MSSGRKMNWRVGRSCLLLIMMKNRFWRVVFGFMVINDFFNFFAYYFNYVGVLWEVLFFFGK